MSRRRRLRVKTVAMLRAHVRRRAQERFGLILTTEDIEQINQTIRQQTAIFYDAQSGSITRWVCPWGEHKLAVAYDKKRHCIRTVMPIQYLANDRPELWTDDIKEQIDLLRPLMPKPRSTKQHKPSRVQIGKAVTPARPKIDLTGMLTVRPFEAFFQKESR